ncbi:MAG TPA: hypothetical protein VEV17_14455 [Bryobacteraceae bacterium]|nr:hypothetical protein [Bryobacteraceae bacterium]
MEVKEVARSQKKITAAEGGTELNYFLVHHANVSTYSAGEPVDLNAEPGPDGTSGKRLIFYQMGQNATVFPDDVGALLPAGAALKFAIHVHSVGKSLPLRLAAETLKLEQLGMVAPGKSGDFVVLDANPPDNIANTRQIHQVYLRGQEVDRGAMLAERQNAWRSSAAVH